MDGPEYGVAIRKTIDDKAYECGQTSWKPENAAEIAKACLGLKKQ